MKQKKITAANADEQIRQLYETAFPEEEQIPWNDLMRLIGEMHLDSRPIMTMTSLLASLSFIPGHHIHGTGILPFGMSCAGKATASRFSPM